LWHQEENFKELNYTTLKLPLWLLYNTVVAKKKMVSPQQEAHTVVSYADMKAFIMVQKHHW
jgi:hypothetical protein